MGSCLRKTLDDSNEDSGILVPSKQMVCLLQFFHPEGRASHSSQTSCWPPQVGSQFCASKPGTTCPQEAIWTFRGSQVASGYLLLSSWWEKHIWLPRTPCRKWSRWAGAGLRWGRPFLSHHSPVAGLGLEKLNNLFNPIPFPYLEGKLL